MNPRRLMAAPREQHQKTTHLSAVSMWCPGRDSNHQGASPIPPGLNRFRGSTVPHLGGLRVGLSRLEPRPFYSSLSSCWQRTCRSAHPMVGALRPRTVVTKHPLETTYNGETEGPVSSGGRSRGRGSSSGSASIKIWYSFRDSTAAYRRLAARTISASCSA